MMEVKKAFPIFKYNIMEKGFTLLDFSIYIAILGITLSIIGAITLNIFFGRAKLIAIEEVSQNSRFILEKISRKIHNAESINSPLKGASDTLLSLQIKDPSKNPTIFYLADGIIRIQEGNNPPVILNSDEVVVTNLQFTNLSYPDTPGTIRIQMDVRFVNPSNRQEYNFGKTFYTTVNIRKK